MRKARTAPVWLAVLVCVAVLWPGVALGQGGASYTVQAGDSLGYIAATYGTTVDAIMEANGLTSEEGLWVGQTLTIPVQAAPAGNGGRGSSYYTVQLGDTIVSIAEQLGVDSAALARANDLTDPDFLYVGQTLLVPGTALGSPAIAPPAQPAREAPTRYTVQPGDTLANIAEQLGVSTTDLAAANGLTDADLLLVGQRLLIPGAPVAAGTPTPTPGPGGTSSARPTSSVDLSSIPTVGPRLTAAALPKRATVTIIRPPSATQVATVAPAAVPSASAAAAMPTARPSATPAPTVEAYTGPTSYIVQPGDTLVSIAEALGIRADALAAENGITNVEIIHVGQELLLPNPAGTATPRPPSDTPPVPVNHVVQSGETLGSIARKYGISASSIARANQITSPDLVSVGMTLAIPSPAWTSPKLSGAVSRFVASISQQRCWLYQGNQVVADWPCSTGKPGTETHPGSYKIQSKLDRAYGSTWNIWMPYWLGIYWAGASENGIHGIPYDPEDNTKRLWEGLVGTPVTYGCVLLNDEHAKQLYDLAYIGMPVIVLP